MTLNIIQVDMISKDIKCVRCIVTVVQKNERYYLLTIPLYHNNQTRYFFFITFECFNERIHRIKYLFSIFHTSYKIKIAQLHLIF